MIRSVAVSPAPTTNGPGQSATTKRSHDTFSPTATPCEHDTNATVLELWKPSGSSTGNLLSVKCKTRLQRNNAWNGRNARAS